MKKRLKSINPLLAFLLLSLIALFSFVGDYHYFLPKSNQTGFKYYVEPSTVFEVVESSSVVKLKKYNSNFDLFYSVNGGETYHLYKNQNLNDIKMNDLTKYTTSIRYKHPFGEMPEQCVVLVKSKHKLKFIYTLPKVIVTKHNFESKLPVVNLVINEKDLISDEKGMLVLGQNSWQDVGFYKEPWYRHTNYAQRGDDWLKKSYFQYFEKDSLLYETICGIQISGHASRSFPQKSMKLKANKKFSRDKLNFPFFGKKGLKKYSALVLRSSGNDNSKTMFADLLMQNIVHNENVLCQLGKAVNVFINGNYWGIFNLRERHNAYYIAKSEKVKSKDVTVLEKQTGRLKSGDAEIQKEYVNFIDSISGLSEIDEKCYEVIKEKISIKSFIDYIIIETFYANQDWLHNNTLWYKAGNKKWKWLIVDLDQGLAYSGNSNVNSNFFQKLKESRTITAKLFNTLIQNNLFKLRFKARSNQMMHTTFSDDNIQKEFDLLKNRLNEDIKFQIARWRGNYNYEKWELNYDNNLQFLLNRKSIYSDQVGKL